MSSNLCPNGHLWQTQPGDNPGQPSLVCAVCGLVADFVSEVLVLGAMLPDDHVVLLQPDRQVENGRSIA